MLSIWCLLFQVSGGTVQELITALRQMDHTEAIEIIQEALSSSRRLSPLEDSTAKALPSSSSPLTFANGETGKIDSKIWRALFKTFFQFSLPTLSRTADRLHTFSHTVLHLHTGFRNVLRQHDPLSSQIVARPRRERENGPLESACLHHSIHYTAALCYNQTPAIC